MISDAEYFNHNKNNYKWYIYCNIGNGAWEYHWEINHTEWKNNQGKDKLVDFADTATNEIIYWSYLVSISDKYVKE